MCEAFDDHEGSVSIGGRLITNFRFADDIVVNAEVEDLVWFDFCFTALQHILGHFGRGQLT